MFSFFGSKNQPIKATGIQHGKLSKLSVTQVQVKPKPAKE